MDINIKVMGTLREFLSEGKHDVPEGISTTGLLELLDASKHAGVVMVNNKPRIDREAALNAGDDVLILGVVGGG